MYEFGYRSDVGVVRKLNEDNYAIIDGSPSHYAVLCDGMGGHNAGEVAAQLAVEAVVETLQSAKAVDVRSLRDAAENANSKVFSLAIAKDGYKGMGTTLVIAAFEKDITLILNVGDSRAYYYSGQKNEIKQITRDHSLLEEMLSSNQLSEDQVENFPYKNVITRSIGTVRKINPDVFEAAWSIGDSIVLCSDGLTNHVDDEEIAEILATASSPKQSSDLLIELAIRRGGKDNVTVIVVKNCEDGTC